MAHQIRKPTVHDCATYWMAYSLKGHGRCRANAYVCYALRGCPSNAAGSHPGRGHTEREALLDATYWVNQAPWIRVVPESKAPQSVLEELAANEDHNAELTEPYELPADTATFMATPTPRGQFRAGHDGGLACMHRDCSCCDLCRDAHEEIVDVYGVCFWVADPKERASLKLDLDVAAQHTAGVR